MTDHLGLVGDHGVVAAVAAPHSRRAARSVAEYRSVIGSRCPFRDAAPAQ